MRFAKGDKVVQKETLSARTNYVVNEVVSFLDGAVLTKYWGNGFGSELERYDYLDNEKPGGRNWRAAIQRFLEEELCTTEEAAQELTRLESDESLLEQEFEKTRDQIKTKLDKAADLVKEANEIFKPLNKNYYNLIVECGKLHLALSDGGWAHSSLVCRHGR